MQIFLVGGAVRDELIGLPVVDRDWVVIGATPSEMLSLGFKQVGKDFPVFLHPETNEQYALARTERKVAPGYNGFVCVFSKKVTLEEDLLRRDLTINAIAKSQDGIIIDPFGGQADLANKILRHVSHAFVEDPVRVLRVARFFARFHYLKFTVDPTTLALMRQISTSGELEALVKERVWVEFSKALETSAPAQFLLLLNQVGALAVIAPELCAIDLAPLTAVASKNSEVLARFGALARGFALPAEFVACAQRLGLPEEFKSFGLLCLRYQRAPVAPTVIYALFKDLRLYHQGKLSLLEHFLAACEDTTSQPRLIAAFLRSQRCAANDLQLQGFSGPELGDELARRRIELIGMEE